MVAPETQGAHLWDAWPRRVEGGRTGAEVGRTGRRRRHVEAAASGEAGGARRGGGGGGTRLGAGRVARDERDVRRGRDVRRHRGRGLSSSAMGHVTGVTPVMLPLTASFALALRSCSQDKDYCASWNILLGAQII